MRHYEANIMRQKYYKQKQIGNVESVNSLMIQWNASYQHVQYWQGNSTYRDMLQCVQNCIVTGGRKWGGGRKLDNKQPYGHVQKLVETVEVRLPYCGTDRTAASNKPDSTVSDNKQETRVSIDTALPADRNVIKKVAEKFLKYKDHTIEIRCMWNVKAKVIPVIMGATGTVSESLQAVPEQNTGKARN